MKLAEDQVASRIEQQLDREEQVVQALEALNEQLSTLLTGSGINGPSESDLLGLDPMIQELQACAKQTGLSRKALLEDFDPSWTETQSKPPNRIRGLIQVAPQEQQAALHAKRDALQRRMVEAQQQLFANQVVVFYSTEFHRSFLLGVLQCEPNESQYGRQGQPFKLGPERVIGRNC